VTVSTHVLDATAGMPAAGVPVALSFRSAGGWLPVEAGETGPDGRHRFGAATEPGVYRLTFGTDRYFAARGVATFYPEVTITFTVPSAAAPDAPDGPAAPAAPDGGHYHVPLLLSPFGYSTYRGS
jgi:5-hydroxyisourate hydrolase